MGKKQKVGKMEIKILVLPITNVMTSNKEYLQKNANARFLLPVVNKQLNNY